MIIEAFDILDKLESTTKRNEKIEILQTGADNVVLQDLLIYAYDPYLKYNIVEFGEVTPEGTHETNHDNLKKFVKHLHLLESRVLTGGEAIATISTFFSTLNEQEFKWYSRVLKKDLRAGITATTINKVFPKLVPKFDCMLAKPWEKVKRKPEEVILDEKLDGYRALAFVTDYGVEILTRNGKEIKGFTELENDLFKLPAGYVYDGELIGKDEEFTDMQKLVFNKKVDEKAGTLVVFDYLPIEEFKSGKSKKTLRERKKGLQELYTNYETENINFLLGSNVKSVENDWNEVEEFYESCINNGLEGIMIKDANSLYECKRTNSWTKWKPFELIDLEVVGSVEGKGKFEGVLGALIVDFEGYEVEIGSGFTDSMRIELWENRNELVGKVIEVQYQDVTNNDKGTKSLRFPTFKQFRPDKE